MFKSKYLWEPQACDRRIVLFYFVKTEVSQIVGVCSKKILPLFSLMTVLLRRTAIINCDSGVFVSVIRRSLGWVKITLTPVLSQTSQ